MRIVSPAGIKTSFQFQSYLILTQITTLTYLQSKPPHSRVVVRHGVGGALWLGGWLGGFYIGRMKWARHKCKQEKAQLQIVIETYGCESLSIMLKSFVQNSLRQNQYLIQMIRTGPHFFVIIFYTTLALDSCHYIVFK